MKYEEKRYTIPASAITLIQTDLSSERIYFEPGEGDQIRITYQDRIGKPWYQITENNGTLRIYQRPIFHLFHILGHLWNQREKLSMTVTIPEAYAGSYDFNVASGMISLEKLEIKEQLEVYAASGMIRLNELTCRKDVMLKLTSGNMNIAGVAIDGAFKCKLTSGKIIGKDIRASEVRAAVSSGTISLDVLTLEKGMEASVTSGTIRASLTDTENNYRITSDVTSGRSNLPENFGNGDKYIDVAVISGNVDVTFGQ